MLYFGQYLLSGNKDGAIGLLLCFRRKISLFCLRQTDSLQLFYVEMKFLFISLFPFFSWDAIVNYVNKQYESYLTDESGLNRRNIVDNRVHCCLYFINPVGHG